MKRALVAGLVVAALVIPQAASGHRVARGDPNDTSGRLDIRRVSVDHGSKILSIVFWEPVRMRHLAEGNYAGWNLNKDNKKKSETEVYAERARRPSGRLVIKCKIYVDLKRVGTVVADLNGTKLECEIPRGLSFASCEQDSPRASTTATAI